jgi:hypothetical protein
VKVKFIRLLTDRSPMDKAWFKQFMMKVSESNIDRVLDSNLMTSWEIESLKAASIAGHIKD